MDTLSQILRILLRKIPPQLFMNGEMDCTDVERSYLAKAIHTYYTNYSDTETRYILEGMTDLIVSRRQTYDSYSDRSSRRLSVFDSIFQFAEKMLTMMNNQVMCRYEYMLRWRMTTIEISEELFVAAYMALHDTENGIRRYDLTWPVVIGHNNMRLRSITENGMAENHFHLWGSAPYFQLSWLNLMNDLTRSDYIQNLKKLDSDLRTEYRVYDKEHSEFSLAVYCKQAALIRLFLFARLTDTPLSFMKQITQENSGDESKFWENQQRLVFRLLNNLDIFERHADEIQDSIENLVDDSYKAPADYMLLAKRQDIGERKNLYDPLWGERYLYYEMFCRLLKWDERLSPSVYNLFYAYILIKEKIRGELVQSNTAVGFENFQIHEMRKRLFSKDERFDKMMAKMAVQACFQQAVILLEARISPKDTAYENYQRIQFLDKAIGKKDTDKFYYVYHFIKREDKSEPDPWNMQCRHWELRNSIKTKMDALLMLRQNYPKTASRVLGIDAASQEIGCRPEVFAQVFRTLKKHIAEYYKNSGKIAKLPQLRATYHVGEDFLDITDGLRAIDEAIRFLNLDCGDRLGHALALGISVREWYNSKNCHFFLPAQDYLDNLVWLYHAIVRYKIPGFSNLKNWIESEFHKCFSKIYEKNIRSYGAVRGMMPFEQYDSENRISLDIDTYYHAWKLRGDNPQLYEGCVYNKRFRPASLYEENAVNKIFPTDFSLRDQVKISYLYYCYHYNVGVRKSGGNKVEFFVPDDYIRAVEQVQKAMQREVAQRGISIETNPSSNYLIGTFKRYDKHPISVFYNNKLTLRQEELEASPQIWVSINTDDSGVFSISLENEYALLANALEKKVDENGNPLYKKTMIYEWLNHIREMGIRQSFLRRR